MHLSLALLLVSQYISNRNQFKIWRGKGYKLVTRLRDGGAAQEGPEQAQCRSSVSISIRNDLHNFAHIILQDQSFFTEFGGRKYGNYSRPYFWPRF
jgi:hypothetical protein